MEKNKEEFDCNNHGHFFTMGLFVEVFILILHPIPFFDKYIHFHSSTHIITYFFNELMLAAMSMRIYFLIRTVMNYTDFMDAYAINLCSSYGFETSIFFTIKSRLIIHPETTVISIFFGTIIIFAYLVRIFEMPYFRSIG